MDFKDQIDNECAHNLDNNEIFCSPYIVVDKLKTILNTEELTDKNDLEEIKDKLKNKLNCDTEACIISHPESQKVIGNPFNILDEYFKPVGPRNSTKWFSNTDIDAILKQTKKKYLDRHFLHIPFQMIDFESTQSELATLDWPQKYKEGYRTFGTVFNTDTSYGMGKHWFSIYGSFEDTDENFTIEYFNSSGGLPMDQIVEWANKAIVRWQPSFTKPIKFIIVTRIMNQVDNHSCGSYSLYYIMSRLNGTPYSYFKHNKIGDENMHQFRKFLFRDEIIL